MTNKNDPFNHLSPENGVLVAHCSSQTATCPARNVLLAEKRAIWISDQGLPQSLVIDMTNIIKRPKFFKCFGFYCWHDYPSNPSVIELLVSTDGEKYITWTVVHAELRAGVQLFPMDPLGSRYNFLKIVIKETFGASKTYLNQLLLFEENPLNNSQNNPILTESPIMSTTRITAQQKKKENALEDMLSNRSPMNANQDQKSAPNKRKSLGGYYTAPHANHPLHKTSQSQILDYDQTERGNLASHPGAQQRLDRDPNFIPQPNFENQTGQFLSPAQDIFTNANLSLLQETSLKSPHDHQNLQARNVKPFLDQVSARVNEPNVTTPHANVQQNFGSHKNQFNMLSPPDFIGQQQQHYPEFVNKPPADVRSSIRNQQADHPEHIQSFGNEYKKEGHLQAPKDRETFNVNDNNTSEADLPLLTHSEKEVKQMKQEMKKWGVTMSAMQDNMNKLLEKVSSLHDTIEVSKPQERPSKRASLPKTLQEDTARSEQNKQNNQMMNNYLEDFREDILGYLDNVANQNQVIIQENQKLRQDLEHLIHTQHSTGKGYQEVNTSHGEPAYYSTQDQNTRDIERVVTNVFDKNIRAWENIFYAQMKTQTDLLEDRITHKLVNAMDSMKDREQTFKQKILDEFAHLENKIAATKLERTFETKTSPIRRSPINPIKERSAIIREETNTYSYTNEPTSHMQTTSFANRGNPVLEETRRATPAVRRPITSPKSVLKNSPSNAANIEKVQYLMSKLQEKIALRDEKVKALQHSVSSSGSYGENFTPNRHVDRSFQDYRERDLRSNKR